MKKIYRYFLVGETHPITHKRLVKDTLVEFEVQNETEMTWEIKGHDTFRGPRGFNKAGWFLTPEDAKTDAIRVLVNKSQELMDKMYVLKSRAHKIANDK